MSYFDEVLSQYFVPGFQTGYYDILIMSRNPYYEPDFVLNFNDIDSNYYFAVSNLNVAYNQSGEYEGRLAGEGPDNNTFAVGRKEISLSFTMPIKMESWGYTSFSFDAIYDYFLSGYKGTETPYIGRFNEANAVLPIGSTQIQIDNIIDFLNISVPFSAKIKSDLKAETEETVTITNVNKANKTVTLSSGTIYNHTSSISYVYAVPETLPEDRQPQFSLLSLREGFFVGCIVEKISFKITPDSVLEAEIEVKALDIDSKYQIDLTQNFNTIISNLSKRKPHFKLHGSKFRVENTTTTPDYFKLGFATDDSFFNGYEGLNIPNFTINSISLDLVNNLEPVYTLHSKMNSYAQRFGHNMLPLGYYSKGRKISGEINYTSPMSPFALADKLAGFSSVNNGGIRYNFGPFKIEFNEVTWSPDNSQASIDTNHTKIVKWSIATDSLLKQPILLPTGTF
jgi:hypothetical protein